MSDKHPDIKLVIRAERIAKAISQDPSLVYFLDIAPGFLSLQASSIIKTSIVSKRIFKNLYPEEYKTWQAHQALEKLKNSGE